MTTFSTSTSDHEGLSPTRILFICLGNICRSPAAEGIMQTMIDSYGVAHKYAVDSAGIGGWHVGELPDKRMRNHAYRRGYNLLSRARQFGAADFDRFDYIVVMDDENYRNLSLQAKDDNQLRKILKMKDYFQQFRGETSVPDPYYGGDADFEWALDLIEDGCRGLLKALENNSIV